MRFQLHCERAEREVQVDFAKERRLRQLQRNAYRAAMVADWLGGEWETGDACDCGRNHRAVIVTSQRGIERLCPCVLWGWIALHQEDTVKFVREAPMSNLIEPVITIRKGELNE